MIKWISLSLCFLFLLTTCTSSTKTGKEVRILASPTPHAQILEFVKPLLKEKGIDLVIIVSDDYNLPNRALANGEVEANFFQHLPFLHEQLKHFHYELSSLAAIEIEPLGLYSKKISQLSELKEHGTVAVANDPTNEARGLFLLHQQGLIQLDNPLNLQATLLNISSNPKHLHFIEVDAATLPRALEDVDLAAINTNYALEIQLSPLKDALAKEDSNSPYANVLVVKTADMSHENLLFLKEVLTSEKTKQFILEKYKGAIIPAF